MELLAGSEPWLWTLEFYKEFMYLAYTAHSPFVSFPRGKFTKMSSDRQRPNDESPSPSSGSSDADQRDPAAPEPEEQEERKPATQQKKHTKL